MFLERGIIMTKFTPVVINFDMGEGENPIKISGCSYENGITRFFIGGAIPREIACKGYFEEFGKDSETKNDSIAETMSQTHERFPMIKYRNNFIVRSVY